MKQNISTLVLDVGAVLLDWNPSYVYEKLIPDDGERQYFLNNICTMEWNGTIDKGKTFEDAIAELKSSQPEKYHSLIEAWWLQWPDMCGGTIDATFEIAEELRKEYGIPVYGLTNFPKQAWVKLLNIFPVFETFFDGVIVSGQVEVSKPDPAIYQLLIDKFQFDPKGALFVDDRPENTAAAEKIGFMTHTFDTSEGLKNYLDNG